MTRLVWTIPEFLLLGGRSLPCHDDVDSRALGGECPDGFGSSGLLPVSRGDDGAMGRAGSCLFYRRQNDRRDVDRNGLRPCRYQVTTDGLVVLASEAGVLPADAKEIRMKGRLQPGRMFLVDTVQGRIIDDEEIKADIVGRKPYRSWVTQYGVSLDELPEPLNVPQPDHPTIRQRQQAFGYTVEELKMVITPMIVMGEEAISSMGTDTPLAVLSDRPQLLFKYFKQLFAQVTNPPIDPIREQLVMSLVTNIGPKPNLMDESPESCRRIKVQQPILTNADLQKIRGISDPHFKSKTLRMLFRVAEGPDGLGEAVDDLCRQASQAIKEGGTSFSF